MQITGFDDPIVAMGHAAVWIKALWSDPWAISDDLMPVTAEYAVAPTVSQATLAYNYGSIVREGNSQFVDYNPENYIDKFIKIATVGESGDLHQWHGIIAREALSPYGEGLAQPSGEQGLIAYGLESMLDLVTLHTANVLVEPSTDTRVTVDYLPTFNLPGGFGNASSSTYIDSLGPGAGQESYVFSPEGELWNDFDIAEYILKFNSPTGVRFVIGGQDDALRSVYALRDFHGSTVLSVLNLLIDRRRGLGWYCKYPDQDGGPVVVEVFTLIGDQQFVINGAIIPGNPRRASINLDGDEIVRPGIAKDITAKYDRILVRGARIKSLFTMRNEVDATASTFEKGWSDSLETDYQLAEVLSAGYVDLSDEEKAEINDEYRKTAPLLTDVFLKYIFSPDFNFRALSPVLFPEATWDGGVNLQAGNQFLFVMNRGLLDRLPLLSGYDYTNYPAANTAGDEFGHQYIAPFVLVFDDSDGKYKLIHALDDELTPFGVEVLDREIGLRLSGHPAHWLAKNHWSAGEPSLIDGPGNYADEFWFDWEKMLATVFMETDQRIKVEVAITPGAANTYEGRTKTIDVPSAEYWHVAANTVVGVGSGGQPQYINPVYVQFGLRNDGDILRTIADLAQFWYSRQRQAVSFEMYDMRTPFELGTILECQSNSLDTGSVESIVTSLQWDYRGGTVKTVTAFDELDFGALALLNR